jgi:ABC-type tungstate transport system permease subunit
MASTTSTEQSGLFGHLLPEFKKASGIDIKAVAVGTGQAIHMARRGDADVLFVHDQAAEEKFVVEGGSTKRYPVMYNDFVLIELKADPAAVRGKDILRTGSLPASPGFAKPLQPLLLAVRGLQIRGRSCFSVGRDHNIFNR